jgi:hypothetical protein
MLGYLSAAVAYRVANSKAEAAEQHQNKKKDEQHRRAQRQLGGAPLLCRRKLIFVKFFAHSPLVQVNVLSIRTVMIGTQLRLVRPILPKKRKNGAPKYF